MTTKTQQTTQDPPAAPEPPAAAVALDAHWAATRARLKDRKPLQRTLRICDDQDLKDAVETAARDQRLAAAALENAKFLRDKAETSLATARLADADEALTAATEAADAATIVLTFRALPRREYEDLVKEHPPTEEQAEEGDDLNLETFGPAIVSAASVDGMTLEDAQDYMANWSEAEATALFNAAFQIQRTSRMELGKG